MQSIRSLMTATTVAAAMLLAAPAGAADGLGASAGQAGAVGLKAPKWALQKSELSTPHPSSQPTTTFYLGERNMPRLGMQGTESYGGISHPLTARWASSVEAGVTHESLFLAPQYSLSGRIERRLAPDEAVSMGLKMSALDRSGRTTYAPGLLGEPSADAMGYELNMSYLYGNGNRVGMYYQLAPAQGGSAGLTPGLGTNTLMFSSEHQLSPNWALSYDLSASEPGAILRSPSLGLGLRYRF